MAQNASAQILTLQQECIKRKDQEILQNLLQSLTNRVDVLSSAKINQDRPQQIEQMYSVTKNSTDTLMSSLIDSKSQAAASLPNEQVTAQKKVDSVESTTAASSQASGILSICFRMLHNICRCVVKKFPSIKRNFSFISVSQVAMSASPSTPAKQLSLH